jgi:hypothetical protein
VWLHVDQVNTAALELYQKRGYRVVHRDRCWRPPFRRRLLLCKDLPPVLGSRAAPREELGMQESVAPVLLDTSDVQSDASGWHGREASGCELVRVERQGQVFAWHKSKLSDSTRASTQEDVREP